MGDVTNTERVYDVHVKHELYKRRFVVNWHVTTFGTYNQLQEYLQTPTRVTALLWDALKTGQITDRDIIYMKEGTLYNG